MDCLSFGGISKWYEMVIKEIIDNIINLMPLLLNKKQNNRCYLSSLYPYWCLHIVIHLKTMYNIQILSKMLKNGLIRNKYVISYSSLSQLRWQTLKLMSSLWWPTFRSSPMLSSNLMPPSDLKLIRDVSVLMALVSFIHWKIWVSVGLLLRVNTKLIFQVQICWLLGDLIFIFIDYLHFKFFITCLDVRLNVVDILVLSNLIRLYKFRKTFWSYHNSGNWREQMDLQLFGFRVFIVLVLPMIHPGAKLVFSLFFRYFPASLAG